MHRPSTWWYMLPIIYGVLLLTITHYSLLTVDTDHLLLATGCWLFTGYYLLLTTGYLLLTPTHSCSQGHRALGLRL